VYVETSCFQTTELFFKRFRFDFIQNSFILQSRMNFRNVIFYSSSLFFLSQYPHFSTIKRDISAYVLCKFTLVFLELSHIDSLYSYYFRQYWKCFDLLYLYLHHTNVRVFVYSYVTLAACTLLPVGFLAIAAIMQIYWIEIFNPNCSVISHKRYVTYMNLSFHCGCMWWSLLRQYITWR
jgi:hypothetical protein